MIKRIFQYARHRAVVFRRHKQQSVRLPNVTLQPPDRLRRIAVIILIVERQITDGQVLEREFWRAEFYHRIGQFAIE
jgi:hypothetical protein